MKKIYRIKEIDGKFYPQERHFFFFWDNIRLHDRVSCDWFVRSAQGNLYEGTVTYLIARDPWGAIHWIQPEFSNLEHAKIFIDEYKKFLKEKKQMQKAKYYY